MTNKNIMTAVSGKFHLKLAKLGSDIWNKWAITVISEENIDKVDERFKSGSVVDNCCPFKWN